ncbi:MAG: MobA/MobL family protein [Eubacteriaceae bacterium]|nr:MobA/MobL family protein [Eubacteriaceae bacterium]
MARRAPIEGHKNSRAGGLAGPKPRDWRDNSELVAWRQAWERDCNAILDGRAHIDHRSLKAQGLGREPTIHLGPAAAEKEKRGERTGWGDRNREITQENARRFAARMAGASRSYAAALEKIRGEEAAAAEARGKAESGPIAQIEAIGRLERKAEGLASQIAGLEKERGSLHFWDFREKAGLRAKARWLETVELRGARTELEARHPGLGGLQREAERLEGIAEAHEAKAEEVKSRELPAIAAFYKSEREKAAMRPEREMAQAIVSAYTRISLERGGFAGGAAQALEPEEAGRWIEAKEKEREIGRQRGYVRSR